jgi:phenylacetate-CoA ligase
MTSKFIELTHPLTYKLRGQKRFHYYHQINAQKLTSLDAVREYQLNRLQALVKHAYETVPYYRAIFQEIGFHPSDLKSLADYTQLPVLTRDHVRQHIDEMVSDKFERSKLVYSATGGSTGTPMNYYQSAEYLEEAEGVFMRSLSWVGKAPADPMLKFVGVRSNFDKGLLGPGKWMIRFLIERTVIINAFDISPKDLERAIRLIRLFRPAFYYGYASSISFLAKYVKDANIKLPPVQAVVTSAEKLYPEQRKLIEEAFVAPVCSFYGCREVRNIAAMCCDGNMHQIADCVYTEFEPLASRTEQEAIIVTPLQSYAMPLIRYANGDLGSAKKGECTCGNCFPLMSVDVGRTTDMFLTPEGRWVHGEYFTHLLYGIKGVKLFQFHQVSQDNIVIRVVTDEHFDSDSQSVLNSAMTRIHSDISLNIKLQLQIVDNIPLSRVGKFLFTKSDIKQQVRGLH